MARRIVSAREQVEMLSPWRTAGPRRRFNQDWQHVGFDLMPVDVVSRYMQRKEEGFGDEKSELYELNKQPPLSQQISERGYEKPVHLVTDGKSGSIYDGHHRIDIARQLGHSHIPVEVSWRTLHPDFPEGSYDNKIDPWLKGWLTDMRKGRETVGRLAASARPALAVNINDTHQDYTGQILRGEKTIETRDTNSLRPLIGSRVGISRTHNSPKIPTMVVGYATLGEPKLYENAEDFDADYHLHRVGTDSPHHFNKAKYGVKYGYPLHDVEHEPEPYPPGRGNQKWRPITAIQQPPPGLTFRHWKTNGEIADHFGGQGVPFLAPAVTAHLGDELVGSLEWHPHYSHEPEREGEVSMIEVPRKHRRRGIGTAMWDWAQSNAEPKLHHSPLQSYDGEAWASAVDDREPSELGR